MDAAAAVSSTVLTSNSMSYFVEDFTGMVWIFYGILCDLLYFMVFYRNI
jgi:hypothetical protein